MTLELDQKWEEIEAGLDSVTPGPWRLRPHAVDLLHPTQPLDRWKISVQRSVLGSFDRLDAEHIARLDPDTVRAMIEERKAMLARIAELEARLEIDHYWKIGDNDDNDLERVEVQPSDRDAMTDGIAARDETILLLEDRITELEAEVEELTCDVGRALSTIAEYEKAP